ncbi:2-C-methyl-D-erythritol 4-phosphate cytidylyltransferase [Cucumis melo var. makuwa]|uniref:2-C-methyl-D-erythritol 4-phosphate cytidylyltransferase n=1 Tax=Cucumis melo var. makuwa TaxID=1194695 RepID=A0A5D3CR75_CUCMM|nr:2-C-methyl-D-erythritol 4-phosphate cytidylyltransferase [Cucumis melo var. makuwa]
MSNLKPYHPDKEDNNRNNVMRPVINLKQKDVKEVEEILADKTRKNRKPTRISGQVEEPPD